jgi:hypothetical protein
MDEARALLARFDRIETLERAGAGPAELLEELRHLVREAEAWAALDAHERAHAALDRCRDALGAAVP